MALGDIPKNQSDSYGMEIYLEVKGEHRKMRGLSGGGSNFMAWKCVRTLCCVIVFHTCIYTVVCLMK